MDLEQERFDKRLKSHHAPRDTFKKLVAGDEFLLDSLNSKKENKKDVIYVHIPFCSKICSFCNMRRSLIKPPKDYADLLVRQIKEYGKYDYIKNSNYDAIYFGGGTPTALDTRSLEEVIRGLKEYLPVSEDAEFTIETSISELDSEKIDLFKELGVNRYSIGVQTFSDKGRKTLGRRGDAEDIINKIGQLKNKGFTNINVDLIYNYPEESLDELEKDLDYIMSLDLAGFSLYSLIIDQDSVLGKKLKNPDDFYRANFAREKLFFNRIVERALEEGHDFKVLTKLVREDRDYYRYVLDRYEGGDTLAIGAGAGGNLKGIMYANPLDLKEYKIVSKSPSSIKGIKFNNNYGFINQVIGQVQVGKIDLNYFKGRKCYHAVLSYLKELEGEKFLVNEGNIYNFTKRGIFWGNSISNELVSLLTEYI